MSSSIHIQTIEALPNIKEYHLVEEITAGYSGDKKYKLEKDGKMYLLRVGDKSSLRVKQKEFEQLRLYQKANINTQRPVEFGVLYDVFYSIVTWIDGTSVMEIIKSDLNKDYYELGRKAGIELKKIHSLSVSHNSVNWYAFIKQKAEQLMIITLDFISNALLFLNDDSSLFWEKSCEDLLKELRALQSLENVIPIEINNISSMPFPDMKIVCRDREIEEIKEFIYGRPGALRKQVSMVLFGYGGVGKTALAILLIIPCIPVVT